MQETAGVIVVGCRVIGCSTAYHLARAGAGDVVVLEQSGIGAGASSKSAAQLTAWPGVRPLTPDGWPIVGRYPGLDGLVFNCGWGGVGFIMAPVVARLAAECVMQGAIQMIDGAALDPGREGGGGVGGSVCLACRRKYVADRTRRKWLVVLWNELYNRIPSSRE